MEIAYFDQFRTQLDPNSTLSDVISPGSDWVEIGGAKKHVIGYLEDFLFAPERSRSPVSSLSGGERNRLLLARLFAKPANVLVLDEPTNDLDIETLELLEELLQNYDGTLFLVSHDRTFLDNVVTQTIAAEGDGNWQEYAGGYSDWANYKASVAKEAAKPKADVKLGRQGCRAGQGQGRQAVMERAARTRSAARQDRRPGGRTGDAESAPRRSGHLPDRSVGRAKGGRTAGRHRRRADGHARTLGSS